MSAVKQVRKTKVLRIENAIVPPAVSSRALKRQTGDVASETRNAEVVMQLSSLQKENENMTPRFMDALRNSLEEVDAQ